MKLFHAVSVSLALLLSTACVCLAAETSNLRDLSDLPKIEKALTSGIGDSPRYRTSIVTEMKAVRRALECTPSRRDEALRKLADDTRWGTPERATVYYVCAWYGVKYERCRDYLLNCFFWGERGFGKKHPDQEWPFCWAEDTVDHLYHLYEHKYDIRLLHDLVTGYSDGAGAEVLGAVRLDALAKHPRGMLRVAGISKRGRSIALDCFDRKLSESEAGAASFSEAYLIFPAYVRRVAADKRDPLSKLARGLLIAHEQG